MARPSTAPPGLALLDDAELRDPWLARAAAVAARDDVHGLVAGRVNRILLDAGGLDRRRRGRRLGRAVAGRAAPPGAAWLDGFLAGDAVAAAPRPRAARVVDGWVRGLDETAFEDLLPLLRRTFARFSRPSGASSASSCAGARRVRRARRRGRRRSTSTRRCRHCGPWPATSGGRWWTVTEQPETRTAPTSRATGCAAGGSCSAAARPTAPSGRTAMPVGAQRRRRAPRRRPRRRCTTASAAAGWAGPRPGWPAGWATSARYFPSSVVQVMQRDAMERLGLRQLLLEPEMLGAVAARRRPRRDAGRARPGHPRALPGDGPRGRAPVTDELEQRLPRAPARP